jgi:hypothetical protein
MGYNVILLIHVMKEKCAKVIIHSCFTYRAKIEPKVRQPGKAIVVSHKPCQPGRVMIFSASSMS